MDDTMKMMATLAKRDRARVRELEERVGQLENKDGERIDEFTG